MGKRSFVSLPDSKDGSIRLRCSVRGPEVEDFLLCDIRQDGPEASRFMYVATAHRYFSSLGWW
jgi:hypothetical protein